jgi:gas vesicle protein
LIEGEFKMTEKNQFWRGMLIGALAGGAISLLDKHTRETMKENVLKTSKQVTYIVKNPGEVVDKVKGTAEKIRTTFEQMSEDITYIADKVDELRELTPQVTELIKETKDTFGKSEELNLLDDIAGDVDTTK